LISPLRCTGLRSWAKAQVVETDKRTAIVRTAEARDLLLIKKTSSLRLA
jgi:hypothetical protein